MKCIVLAVLLVAVSAENLTLKKSLPVSDDTKLRVAKAIESGNTRDLVVEINEYADQILEEVDAYIISSGYDPAKLEDIHLGFEYKPLLITYHGELDLTSGWLQSLSTLHREGDAIVTVGSDSVVIEIELGLNDLVFDYQYSAKLMDLGPTGGIDGKVASMRIALVLSVDLATGYVSLQDFDIVEAGKISLKFSGNSLVDWMTNLFTQVITTVLHDLIIAIAENVIRGRVDDVIDQLNNYIANGAV